MTSPISSHKASKIINYYLQGLPQDEIAAKCGANQSTVSRCVSKFERATNKASIASAAKAYNVMQQVDALRSLAAELKKSELLVEEAHKGAEIIKLFKKLGVASSDYQTLIKVIKKACQEDFIPAAMKLVALEKDTGKGYFEIVAELEQLSSEYKHLQKENIAIKEENKTLAQDIKTLKLAKKKVRLSLSKAEKESQRRCSALEAELEKKLQEKSLTQERLKKLDRAVDILQRMKIPVEKLETYLQEHQELERLGLTMGVLKIIIKAMDT